MKNNSEKESQKYRLPPFKHFGIYAFFELYIGHGCYEKNLWLKYDEKKAKEEKKGFFVFEIINAVMKNKNQ